MHHSMKPHPAITATLLDFMCRVRQGVFNSLTFIMEKRVLADTENQCEVMQDIVDLIL
ncbi:hypothetical protein CRUP_017233, partial [Coryphaenoides rupestris]